MTDREFSDFFLPLYKPMYGLATAMLRDSDAAADVVQDVMTGLWEKRRALDVPQSARAYVMIAVRNRCVSGLRGSGDFSPSGLLAAMPSQLSSDDAASLASTRRLVDGVLDAMPAQAREVMQLSLYGECSNSEIEQITGLTGVNVRAILSRGRRKLREVITKNISR